MEKNFTTRLKNELAKFVRGYISAHFIVDDTLLVEIDNGATLFHYTLKDISTNISNGLTSEMVSKDICKQYKRYIFNKYFYTNSEKIS